MYLPTKRSHHLVLFLCYILLPKEHYLTLAAKEASSMKCIDKEREALLKFNDNIEIDRCGFLTSWDREGKKDCCKWHGVFCNNYTGHVTMLDLRSVYADALTPPCLEGKLSTSLLDLEHLNYLDLSCNYFGAQPIPAFIGSLGELRYLNLSGIGFQGYIPHQLGNLSKLMSLDLNNQFDFISSMNLYTNKMWSSIAGDNLQWLSKLTLLKYLDLSGTSLDRAIDWLQVINNLPSLTDIRMSFCDLPNVIQPPLPHANTSRFIRVLHLKGNNLKPSFYQWLFNLSGIHSHLVDVDLSFNYLEGSIPGEFSSMHLTHLDLSGNYIQGRVPENFRNLCSLQSLGLYYNNLTEELSSIFQTLSHCAHKSLLILKFGSNRIWGSVPNTISRFSSLRQLSLSNNRLNGTISEGTGQLSKLESLDLSLNSLGGTISKRHFSKLSQLRYLGLSHNSAVVFNISSKWVPPFQLSTLSLQSCMFGPQFPRWLQTQRSLQNLDISDAGILDTIPSSFWSSLPPHISSLNMSHNRIHGTIPDLSISFHNFPDIDLSSNNFEGTVPSFLTNASSLLLKNNMFSDSTAFLCPKTKVILSNLDLSNNLFLGKLPNCWMYFDRLAILHLENNKFSGKLPTSIGAMLQLQSLHFRNNSFSGELPMSLENCTSLNVLDLGHNLLTGNIPHNIGNSFRNLTVLSLQNNNFSGKLPLSLCKLPHLQILDLSINHISGTIPKCIYNLTGMTNITNYFVPYIWYNDFQGPHDIDASDTFVDAATVMWQRKEENFRNSLRFLKFIDVSSNMLQGEVPEQISSLTGLVALNLSTNNFSGVITPTIGELTSLELLDLSNNHFSGEIPMSLATLTYLHLLDMANNNLSGRIPLSTQLQSFNASVYMGNSDLCGAPLPNMCPGDQAPPDQTTGDHIKEQQRENGEEDLFPGLYISIVLGFIVGFWGVCGTLVLKRSCRQSCFHFLDSIINWLYVMIVVNIARIRKKPRN